MKDLYIWNSDALHCALGRMLDLRVLVGPGLIDESKVSRVSKRDLIGYALYLHTRGGLLEDLRDTYDELNLHLKKLSKNVLVKTVNERLMKKTRAHLQVHGAKRDKIRVEMKYPRRPKIILV